MYLNIFKFSDWTHRPFELVKTKDSLYLITLHIYIC